MLAKSNVPPAIAMQILRHRDIRLTLELYTDEALLPAAAAMACLPSLTGNINGAQIVPTRGHKEAARGMASCPGPRRKP